MTGSIAAGLGLMIAGAALAGAAPAGAAALRGSFSLVELRRYTLHDGQRDVLIRLFEREFVESQEAVGMKVIGTFTDLDRPNHFVWLRGFRDRESRKAGLNAFYGGPVWKAHRNAANATMIDSDNVLLLREPHSAAGFNGPVPAGLIVATIYYLKSPAAEALAAFEAEVKPRLEAAGLPPIGWYVPETAANNFPALPVREGEQVLVWFARFDGEADHAARRADLARAAQPMADHLQRDPEVLRLKPTLRSELGSNGERAR